MNDEEADRLWKQKVAEALAIVERNPAYASIVVQIDDGDREIKASTPTNPESVLVKRVSIIS
jgi:hypothetical protein